MSHLRPFDVDSILRFDFGRNKKPNQQQQQEDRQHQHPSDNSIPSDVNICQDQTVADDEQGVIDEEDTDFGRLVIDIPEQIPDQDSCIGSTSFEEQGENLRESIEEESHRSEEEEEEAREESGACSRNDSGILGEEEEDFLEEDKHIENSDEGSHTKATSRKQLPLKVWMFKGSRILARWTDGLFYQGTILKVDELSRHAEVEYEDGSKYWTDFKDLHKQLSGRSVMTDSDILCSICRDGTSVEPNEIVMCDVCNQGYHQRCHRPKIPASVLEPDVPWSCRLCKFALGAAQGGADKETTQTGRDLKLVKGELPYDLKDLIWDEDHRVNHQKMYCYCGGPGKYFEKMLQCQKCLQWFHEACIQCLEAPLLWGDHFFTFTCLICGEGSESAKRIIMKWSDVVALVLHNLRCKWYRKYFDVKDDIVPFIQSSVKLVKLSEDISKLSEQDLIDKVQLVLLDNPNRFKMSKEVKKKGWALRTSASHPIFAPPNAITSKKCPTILAPTTITPSVIFPYGACRKGASVHPLSPGLLEETMSSAAKNNLNRKKSSTKNGINKNHHQNNQRVTNKVSKITSRTPSVSSSSTHSNHQGKTNGSLSPVVNKVVKKQLRPKIRVENSLEALIPVPDDLMGKDNPFLLMIDQEQQVSSSKKRKSSVKENAMKRVKTEINEETKALSQEVDETSFRLVKKSPTRLTIQRITPEKTSPSSSSLSSSGHLNHDYSPKSSPTKVITNTSRVTNDRKSCIRQISWN